MGELEGIIFATAVSFIITLMMAYLNRIASDTRQNAQDIREHTAEIIDIRERLTRVETTEELRSAK